MFCTHGADDFGRFVAEDVAAGVNGIWTHVKDRPRQFARVGAMILGIDHLGKCRGKKMDGAEFVIADTLDGIQRRRFKVEAVRDHQLRGAGSGGVKDLFALCG